jgi:hypothetical protein
MKRAGRYTGPSDPGAAADMRKTLWKCLAVVPLLGLTLWWIHSDVPGPAGAVAGAQEPGGGGVVLAGGLSAGPAGGGGGTASGGPASSGGAAAKGGAMGPGIAASGGPGPGPGPSLGPGLRPGFGPPGGGGLGFGPGIDPNLSADSPSAGDPAWRRAPLWDDGKAEFCAYEVSWPHYGHVYQGRALLVLVKEPWSPALEVKADRPGSDSFEVLKLNHVRDVATGIYTYHQMASVFWRRDSGALQKIAATSSEACGISYAEMTHGRLQTHSYFDGQGDRTQRYPPSALPEDGLPAALRTFVTGLLPHTVEVFPSLLAGRYGDLAPRDYTLERRPGTVAAGGDGAAAGAAAGAPAGAAGGNGAAAAGGEAGGSVELRLTSGRSRLAYTFETAPPRRLLRFERDDGTVYRLAKCERLVYWDLHDPGGEGWLPPGVR